MTSPWIDVTKGLPPENVDVFAVHECPKCYRRRTAIIDYSVNDGWHLGEWPNCVCDDSIRYTITHWMSIPELPKKKENNGTL